MTIDLYRGKLEVRFSYDPGLVEAIKARCQGRAWRPERQAWHVEPVEANLQVLRELMPRASWTPRAAAVLTRADEISTRRVENPRLFEDDSPLGFPFKTAPYRHQNVTVRALLANPVFALFDEMGTGKTKAVIDTACVLTNAGSLRSLVVVCPNAVKGSWARELRTHAWVPYRAFVWDRGRWVPTETEQPATGLNICILNYEALLAGTRVTQLKQLLKGGWLVLDEASRIKNRTAKRTRACLELGRVAERRLVMTGTPVTQAPLDLWAPMQFLDSHLLGFGSFFAFRAHHAELGGWEGKEVVAWKHLDELEQKLKPFSLRRLKADCLDLPAKVYERRDVTLTDDQWRAYRELDEQLVTEVNGEQAHANIVLEKLLRMQQVTSGFVGVADQQGGYRPVDLPGGNPKLNELMELLDESSKAIVWCRFRHEIELIAAELTRRRIGFVELHGGVKDKDAAVVSFQTDHNIRVFVGQVATGGFGITLTAANLVVYFSNDFSYETRVQSEDRAHRVGQTRSVTYVDLVARTPEGRPTTDHLVLSALRTKRAVADVVTGDYRR